MRINALRLVKQGVICIFVVDNQQNSNQSPMPNANVVEIYYVLNEFSKLFDAALQVHGHKLGRGGANRRASLMSDAEVMTILVLFHTSVCRTLKAFYLGWVCTHGRADFPRLLFLRVCAQVRCIGVSIVDSTPLATCHPKRAAAPHHAGPGGARSGHNGLGVRV